jgi:hypothetical protein
MNSLIKRRQTIIDADEIKRPRAWGNFGGTPVPVAKRAGKRPQVGREGRLYLSMYTPHVELRGKAKTERYWLNNPRQVFIG